MRYFSVRTFVLAMALGPSLGHAAYSLEHVTATCSESLTILRGESLSFQCAGDLSVYGDGDNVGLLADGSITLLAIGRLSVDRLNIVSPLIQLSGGTVDIGRNVVLFNPVSNPSRPPLVNVTSGGISIQPELTPVWGSVFLTSQGAAGALASTIVTVSNVPEPTVGLFAAAGLCTLLMRRRRA